MTYFQGEEARLLLRPVWVDFDSLAAPELLQLGQTVAGLNCSLAVKHRVDSRDDIISKHRYSTSAIFPLCDQEESLGW